MIKKPGAFISGLGRHNIRSIGKDLGMDKLNDIGNSLDGHEAAHTVFNNLTNTLGDLGLKSGEKVVFKLIDSTVNGLLNNNNPNSVLSGSNLLNSLGINNCSVYRTKYHIGQPTTKKIKNQLNTPLVVLNKKSLATDLKDYQSHDKRKQLVSTSGFNEKGFTFFLEDTFLQIKDLIKLFDKDKRIKQNILKNKNGIRNVYGCIYNTCLNLKIRSSMNYYTTSLQIHLIKMNDIHDDPRQLLEQITNNNFDKVIEKIDVNKNLRGNEQDDDELLEKNISKSNLKKTIKNSLIEKIKRFGTHRARIADRGKIPEDEQYTDPQLSNKNNRFASSFCTSIKTQLNDSILFKDRAKIVHTWCHKMNPGSIWDFTLVHHFGKGIHLNYLYDIELLNENNCVGYFLVLEQLGDRRATLIRISNNDKFDGNGPSSLRYSFEHSITYLGIEDDDASYEDDAKPSVYKTKRREEDFAENSEFSKTFTPDREPAFHVNHDDIDHGMSEANNKKNKKKKKYILEYNASVLPSEDMLETMKQKFENIGFDPNSVDYDDVGRNVGKPPSSGEYEGTEDQDILDLDNEGN